MVATTLREVLDRWDAASRDPAALARLDATALARCALDLGHPTLACEILAPRLRGDVVDAHDRYLAALAHARIGSFRDAGDVLAPLLREAPAVLGADPQALAGRIAKDRWARLPAGAARDREGALAIRHYRQAWEASGAIFPGINAATMLLLTGAPGPARELAREVRARASAALDSAALDRAAVEQAAAGAEDRVWREATLGEAALLLGDGDAAARHYRAAVALAGRNVGHVASMRRQLRLIAGCLPVPAAVEAALALPRVVVFTGHMLDAPGRVDPRFPREAEARVAASIAERLATLDAGFGYCSAACGADLLFVEAMLARGAEVHLVLPFERTDFIATSVGFAGCEWVARFEAALRAATSVTFGVRERFLGDESLYAYAGALMQGAAILRARVLESEPLMLAVVDADSDGGSGGTRDMLANWDRLALPVERLDLAALRSGLPAGGTGAPVPAPAAADVRSTGLRREVRTMLFADMVGFSRLAEEDTPAFMAHFVGAIAAIVADSPRQPLFVNTWGDGLYMVFGEVADGAGFALGLRDAVRATDWPRHGLPAGTGIRIGMHTGPVFRAPDPLIGRDNYFGSHVVRAARIEPIVAPGAVYISAMMAFALAASGSAGLSADFLGTLPLAKGYGSEVLYRLRRASEAE